MRSPLWVQSTISRKKNLLVPRVLRKKGPKRRGIQYIEPMIDLHTHSTASDGQFSPRDLAEKAFREGLTALALTDHDTTAGLAEAGQACAARGIRFLGGIEVEIEWEAGEFHLLGLDLKNPEALGDALTDLQDRRLQRNRKIFALMQEAGLKGDYSEVEALAAGGQVGRPHFARFLVQRGKVESIQDAFTHFLGKGGTFYQKKAGLDLAQAIDLIHSAGGLALVAHPMSLYLSFTKLGEKLAEWKTLGLDGIEAWHPGAQPRECRRLEKLAREAGLKMSAGSDFHGDNRPDRRLGHTSGGQPISEKILEGLLAETGASVPIIENDGSQPW